MTQKTPNALSGDAARTLLFQTAQRQYDLILARRNTLNTQASSLMSFGGIINTVLVGLLVALGTSQTGKALLMSNPYFQYISVFIGIGFVMYILASGLSLGAFVEVPWLPAPEIVYRPGAGETELSVFQKLKKLFEGYQGDPSTIPVVTYEMQLAAAILSHMKINTRKYYFMVGAFLLLIVGIIFTALAGLLILKGSF
jgi:hypothetical protein